MNVLVSQKNGQPISLIYLSNLYQRRTESSGLATQHNLKYEHIHLTPHSKMRVDK